MNNAIVIFELSLSFDVYIFVFVFVFKKKHFFHFSEHLELHFAEKNPKFLS